MKTKKIFFICILIGCMAFLMNACDRDGEAIRGGELSGTVTINSAAALNGMLRSARAVTGGTGAWQYTWQWSSDGVSFTNIPGRINQTEAAGSTILLSELEGNINSEGNYIRLRVGRTGAEGHVDSNAARIFNVTIQSVTVSIAGSVTEVRPNNFYELTAVVNHNLMDQHPNYFQEVTWNVGGFSIAPQSDLPVVSAVLIQNNRLLFDDSIYFDRFNITATALAAPAVNSNTVSVTTTGTTSLPIGYIAAMAGDTGFVDVVDGIGEATWGLYVAPDGRLAYRFIGIKNRQGSGGEYMPAFYHGPDPFPIFPGNFGTNAGIRADIMLGHPNLRANLRETFFNVEMQTGWAHSNMTGEGADMVAGAFTTITSTMANFDHQQDGFDGEHLRSFRIVLTGWAANINNPTEGNIYVRNIRYVN